MLDPYREEMLDKNFNTFSFGGHLNFEAYVQYQEYCGFTKAMDTLRSMKLMLKGDDGKAVACNIKVHPNHFTIDLDSCDESRGSDIYFFTQLSTELFK